MISHFYLLHFQFLGFRFHGWAKQPNVKTVHEVLDRTIRFVMDGKPFKTLACSRTDAMVSANHMVVEFFLQSPLDEEIFFKTLNENLPPDIALFDIQETDKDFNIIQSPKLKEYLYLFAFGGKFHPFCAPILAHFQGDLDIEIMKLGAQLFEGTHNFKQYCTKPSANTQFERTITRSTIALNVKFTANFFPEETYAWSIHSTGFMRNQIRLMMAQLVELGRGNTTLETLKTSLINPPDTHLTQIAPASGLILDRIHFQ